MATVTNRLLETLLQIPTANAEHFQVLRYDEGQYYKRHHDQGHAHWNPAGVLALTLLVYLSDVPAGGGTRFPDLAPPVTVQPKLGRAVLWPNVGGDLIEDELGTFHESLPVERGVKHAMNVWVRLYDQRNSESSMCPFFAFHTNDPEAET